MSKDWNKEFDEKYPIERFLNGYESSIHDPEIIDFRNSIIVSIENLLAERQKELLEKIDRHVMPDVPIKDNQYTEGYKTGYYMGIADLRTFITSQE